MTVTSLTSFSHNILVIASILYSELHIKPSSRTLSTICTLTQACLLLRDVEPSFPHVVINKAKNIFLKSSHYYRHKGLCCCNETVCMCALGSLLACVCVHICIYKDNIHGSYIFVCKSMTSFIR